MINLYDTMQFNIDNLYDGQLGAIYAPTHTTFVVWCPIASEVKLNLYRTGCGDTLIKSVEMEKQLRGVWQYVEQGDLANIYYTYTVTNERAYEVVDNYAKAGGANGLRGMVVNLDTTNPIGWSRQSKPILKKYVDAIIYETHIRDFTIDASSGVDEDKRGKYAGLSQKGCVNVNGLSTGIDHLVELGITHLHILPMFDFATVNEVDSVTPQYNWGYDPSNYNFPEGSYSSDANQGQVRIRELKEMIMQLHNSGIAVVMDVVYNHTFLSANSNLNRLAPNYYYRTINGQFANGSACGNELASERYMTRKFIIDSLSYWAREYKIDGFRFDLMGLHDIDTINLAYQQLYAVNKNILLYGEGWQAGGSILPQQYSVQKINAAKTPDIAFFNDILRDGIKGSAFDAYSRGFVSGSNQCKQKIEHGIVGGTGYSPMLEWLGWSNGAMQAVNYSASHDNNTLWDKLNISCADATDEQKLSMYRLAASIVMLSQGIPFLLGGEEILRSKPDCNNSATASNGYSHNSYKSSDQINSIKWNEKSRNIKMFDFYKGLIAFRKSCNLLKLSDAQQINKCLMFLPNTPYNVVAFTVNNKEELVVVFNASHSSYDIELPRGKWQVYVDDDFAGSSPKCVKEGSASVAPLSCMALKLSN